MKRSFLKYLAPIALALPGVALAAAPVTEPVSILLLGAVALVVTRQMRRKGLGKV